MNTNELRKHIKHLLKKYHPDLNNENNAEAAHNEIAKKLTAILNDLKINVRSANLNKKQQTAPSSQQPKNGLVALENQDYLYYKQGIKYYKNIHPNFIYKLNSKTEFVLKPYDELMSALNNIIMSIYLAEHYFTKVILEYPDSIWRNDSIAKVKLLLKLTKSYENIDPREQKVVDSTGFVKEFGLKV